MKTKNLFGILILFLLTFSFISCDKDDLTDKVEIVKMYVSAETDTYTPWGSETPIECMLVKEEGNASLNIYENYFLMPEMFKLSVVILGILKFRNFLSKWCQIFLMALLPIFSKS